MKTKKTELNYLKHLFFILRSLRIKEIILMTGFSLIGIVFTNPDNWFDYGYNIKILTFILLYVMSIFFMNSYAGYLYDMNSDRLKITTSIPRFIYLYLFLATTITFSFLAIKINLSSLYFSLGSLFLWLLYYFPPIHLKSKLFGGTIAHFMGGVTHFHIGYVCFEKMSANSLIISILFSLLLCTGHFNHEMIDYQPDKKSGIKTTTVVIGLKGGYYLRTLFILLTLGHLMMLYILNYITTYSLILFLISLIGMLFTSLILKENKPKKFMSISRVLIFVSCSLLILLILIYE